MGNKGRWQEPSDRAARDEYRDLRRELKLSRTSKARRAEIENRLDAIAEKEPSLEKREPKPTTADNLALVERVEAARKTVPVFPVFNLDPAAGRERAIERAKNATPAEKAVSILADLPNNPLNKLAAEVAHWLWSEDKSNPKAPAATLAANCVRHWLSDEPWNRSDVRGSRATVDAAVADALRLVAERDAADPSWFVRRAEKPLDTQPTLTKPTAAHESLQTAERVRTNPVPPGTQPDEPTLNPIERASADLAARAALVLKTDSWLSRLAQHSPDMRTKILASLSEELLRAGFVNGDFATRLYNDSRPKALSQFPPRQF
jgi:hypothetical protein